MSNDFYIDPSTHDIYLSDIGQFRLCNSKEEFIRQQLAIRLKMYFGEWFADINLGVPYFESIYGKNTNDQATAIFKNVILNTDGVISITKFIVNKADNKNRKYTLTFTVKTETGVIENIEV